MRELSDTLCECGCGEFTFTMPRNNTRYGWVAGQPFRFRKGHAARVADAMEWGHHLWRDENLGFTSPCWIFKYAHDSHGYGVFANRNRVQSSRLAHRESYVRRHGAIPDGYDIDHLCRQPACVNPDHLEAVPHRVNLQRGKNAKLSYKIADEIRQRHRETGETYKQLAARYGVEKRTIWEIVKNRRWHH